MRIKEKRQLDGLCVYCGGEMDREGYLCSKCNELHRDWKHDRVIRLHEQGRCTSCGKPLDREGWFCSKCAEKLNSRSKIRNAFRRANRLCIQCGKPLEDGYKYNYCIRCRNMRSDRYYKKKFEEK